ncbi:hypothetical protein [sulfur-oxidizing endosymbiont of Gigantopelta aegis]|uniref:hypothetical protein n=1 Tax=sulfur-oxidizing endosymbiont of Gigantopelta aegis TaxID=2794934 RepID=UPI0018DD7C46|nr:hypothetical protein [sulfur-oxidizing endosymbiont of Gigantopelta aegis]
MPKYCLYFSGEVNHSHHTDTVKDNFKKHFRLSTSQLSYIFSGKEVRLKKELSQEEALNYAVKIDSLGGISYIEAMASTITLPTGIENDRRNKDRRTFNNRRNHIRAGIVSDRRIHTDPRAQME